MKTFILFWSDVIHIFIELLHFLLIVIISGSIIVRVAPTFTAKYTQHKLQYLPREDRKLEITFPKLDNRGLQWLQPGDGGGPQSASDHSHVDFFFASLHCMAAL